VPPDPLSFPWLAVSSPKRKPIEYLLGHCYTVWLKAQPEEHMSRVVAQGDFRAMAGSDRAMEDLRRFSSPADRSIAKGRCNCRYVWGINRREFCQAKSGASAASR